MTRQTNDNVLQAAMGLLNENGFEAYAQVLRILLNEADGTRTHNLRIDSPNRGFVSAYKTVLYEDKNRTIGSNSR